MKTVKKQRVKSSFSVRLTASTALAAGVLSVAMSAQAAPVLDHVVAGGVSVDNLTGVGNVTVTQTTDKGVVNWNSFNIGTTETTQFVQPSANAVTLNRVTGDTNPSQIMGTLTANGKVAIVNPNGVVFGNKSKVDVAGLVATTADMNSDEFMAGGTAFNKDGAAGATVENQGSITAKEGGLVALVAPNVKNSGVITARKGSVIYTVMVW
jgi:filamentous hemagglutinin family protein